ncbi:unnamed protein product [Prorocentrum cordatum]|uniref:Uncharacterized protein n=1 Tax=Prorocentrum cordatum TaxID=2364126 RepID=A0ABN9UB23_9DINO|nr:unnamed protein product [Polarella glacialis]
MAIESCPVSARTRRSCATLHSSSELAGRRTPVSAPCARTPTHEHANSAPQKKSRQPERKRSGQPCQSELKHGILPSLYNAAARLLRTAVPVVESNRQNECVNPSSRN